MLCLRCLLHPSPAGGAVVMGTGVWDCTLCKSTQDKQNAASASWGSRPRKACQKASSSVHGGLAVPTPACRCPRHCANFRKMACCFLATATFVDVTLHRKDSCCEKASASRQQNTPNDPAKMWLDRKVPADRKTYRQAATRSCFGFMAFPSKPASS